MNAPVRKFEAVAAVRRDTPLLIGLEGPPGCGKTWTALLLGDGMREVRGGDVVLIDTEGKRALAYADFFKFKHVDFQPPFKSPDFLAAVQQQLPSNPAAIIIDSASDEHEGEGGYLDWHEEEVDRMLGDDKDKWSRRDAMNQAGWIRPKRARIRMMNAFLRINTPLIFCFRAREKTKPMKQQKNGREVTVPVNIGYQPICPGEIAHAMTMMCLLPPRADGVPQWKSDSTTQDFLIKLPEQFKTLFATPGPITRDHGRALATWAKGGAISSPPTQGDKRSAVERPAPSAEAREQSGAGDVLSLEDMAREAASRGADVLRAFYKGCTPAQQKILNGMQDELKALYPSHGETV